jgi:hypothetical protein
MDRHVGRLIDFLSLVSSTFVLSPHDRPLNSSDASQWLNPAAFDSKTPASQLRYGYLQSNALRGPFRSTLDLALHKMFNLRRRQTMIFAWRRSTH